MTRFLLAFSCLFRLLFGLKLSPKAAAYLPEDALPRLPPKGKAADEVEEAALQVEKKQPAHTKEEPESKPAPKPRPAVSSSQQRDGALALLGLLQREGRFIDFLQEPIDSYADADIGAAVRDIHRGCRKVVLEHLALEPVMPGDEDAPVTVPTGFDPGEIRLIGEVKGDPPFKGVLRHHGWRVTRAELPALSDGIDRAVLAPAEVEVR